MNIKQLFLFATSCLLLNSFFVSCAVDDLDITSQAQSQLLSHRKSQQDEAYKIAIAKLPELYRSTQLSQKRMSSGLPEIVSSEPLWFGDTAIVINPNPDPGVDPIVPPGDTPLVADSIYGYVFNFANNEGSMVVGVDPLFPDLIAYTRGRNLFSQPLKSELNLNIVNLELKSLNVFADREQRIKSMLAELANMFAQKINYVKNTYELYQPEIGVEPWPIPHLDTIVHLDSLHITKPCSFRDGMCPIQLLNTAPYTDLITTLYGYDANCWDIIPTTAMYLATLKRPFNYNGFTFNWNEILYPSEETSYLQTLALTELFYYLGTPDNLDVLYDQQQPLEVIHNIPRTLNNFGVPNNGLIWDYADIYAIVEEINAGYPALAIINNPKNIPTNGNYSCIFDDYEVRERNEIMYITDGRSFHKHYTEYYVNVKFSYISSSELLFSGFLDWGILNPSDSEAAQKMYFPGIPRIDAPPTIMRILYGIGSPEQSPHSMKKR